MTKGKVPAQAQGAGLSQDRQHQRLPVLPARPHCFGEAGGRYRAADRRSAVLPEPARPSTRRSAPPCVSPTSSPAGRRPSTRRCLSWLGTYYSDSEIVELVMVIGLANLVNRFNDTLQVQPDLG
ncbi:MAG: hypothetical protein MZV70_16025 [Desulfobacterales bacterium]|nr:hypothetical protein [Desulfobacterales bacterium]